MGTTIASWLLPVDMAMFVRIFWRDKDWFMEFLSGSLGDINIEVGDWFKAEETEGKRVRHVKSHHPSKISFPGLPAHAESHKTQTMEYLLDRADRLYIRELNLLEGIPYADYFSITIEWCCMQVDGGIHVEVSVSITFHKSTWLQGTIEANTIAELKDLYALWYEKAIETIEERRVHTVGALSLVDIDRVFADRAEAGEMNSILLREEEKEEKETEEEESETPLLQKAIDHMEAGVHSDDGLRTKVLNDVISGRKSSSAYLDSATDDDDGFYDCEEGGSMGLTREHSLRSVDSHRAFGLDHLPTPKKDGGVLMRSHSASGSEGFGSPGRPLLRRSSSSFEGNDAPRSVRDLAVTVVETFFVIIEFSYWKVYGFYQWDLKDFFRISASATLSRIKNSFIPGRHFPLMERPDMYGPLMAVLSMPQVLLQCITHGGGCSRASILGNVVVTSLCLWLGLALLYRLVALLLAPAIDIRHTLCSTGYSFYSWMLAFVVSHVLDEFVLVDHDIHENWTYTRMLPLFIIGLPSSVALGRMFWEFTPTAVVTVHSTSCPRQLQRCAARHSTVLNSIYHHLPKIIAFLFVTATHYQFLWYLQRVFLPGRQQMCRLSVIMNPASYADILMQKELLNYINYLVGQKSGR